MISSTKKTVLSSVISGLKDQKISSDESFLFEALKSERQERKKPLLLPQALSSEVFFSSPPRLNIGEEMIGLYQTISSMLPDSQTKVIQFVGSQEGVGTSTIIKEFAWVSAVEIGKSVLLLDANKQQSGQHPLLNIKPKHDLAEIIKDHKPVEKALYRVGQTGLFVSLVSSGSVFPPHFIETFGQDDVWRELRQRFDLILIDSPPPGSSVNTLAISQKVDGVVLVLEEEKTRWRVAKSVKDKIIKNGGNILGVVLNKRKYYVPEFIYKLL